MSPETAALIVIAFVSGALIGGVGVGGVLLVPALVLIGDLGVQEATPVATASFLFTGIAGTATYQRQERISWSIAGWLVLAAIPGAILGAASNVTLPGSVVAAAVALVLIVAAIQAWRDVPEFDGAVDGLGVFPLIAIGLAVGFGSTLSGTGGPVLLIPVMLLAGSSVALAVSSSQPIQIPIAVFGAASFLVYGTLDWQLAIALGLVQGGGAVTGAIVGNRLPVRSLRNIVGVALVVAAILLLIRTIGG